MDFGRRSKTVLWMIRDCPETERRRDEWDTTIGYTPTSVRYRNADEKSRSLSYFRRVLRTRLNRTTANYNLNVFLWELDNVNRTTPRYSAVNLVVFVQ